jgi:hypothetical protein
MIHGPPLTQPDPVAWNGPVDKDNLAVKSAQALSLLVQISYLEFKCCIHAFIILSCPPFAQTFCAI